MGGPVLFDPSERPVTTPPGRVLPIIRLVWNWIGIPGLTLLVLALQTLVIRRQANIMDQQSYLLKKQTEITEVQQQLASRPYIVTSMDSSGMAWKIENRGPYNIRDVQLRVLSFKKFTRLGWRDSISSEAVVSAFLESGQTKTVDLKAFFFPSLSIRDANNNEELSVPGAEFYVISMVFERAVDDKRFLFLKPFERMLAGQTPRELQQDMTASSGPVQKSCTMDAYAIELTYEFYRRNPLPYPVEPYNYHYLLGDPDAVCLRTGPSSFGW